MIFAGQKVSYVGIPGAGLEIGDVALVVEAGNTASHVKWLTGSRRGNFDQVPHLDLVASTAITDTDALTGALVSFSSRQVYATLGPEGLVEALNDEGHLGAFEGIAEEALRLVASRIRQDPSIIEVLGDLDGEDGEEFLEVVSAALIRDAFTRQPGE